MASNAQGEGASSGSSSKRGRKSGGKAKVPKIKQRGMGIAQLEHLRIQSQMAAAASTANAAAMSVFVPTNLHNVPVYQLLDEGLRVNNPFYLSSRPSLVPEGPQGVKENLSFLMPRCDFWHTSDPAPSWTPSGSHGLISQKMSMASEGSDIQLGRLSTGRLDKEEEDDGLEFQQPNYFTRLLLAEDDEEETGRKNKKARTDSSGDGSAAAAGSSSSQEPNLELRLFF